MDRISCCYLYIFYSVYSLYLYITYCPQRFCLENNMALRSMQAFKPTHKYDRISCRLMVPNVFLSKIVKISFFYQNGFHTA